MNIGDLRAYRLSFKGTHEGLPEKEREDVSG